MLFQHTCRTWDGPGPGTVEADLTAPLESGGILLLPALVFDVRDEERRFFSPSVVAAKNVSFDPATGRVAGSTTAGEDAALLAAWLRRFSEAAGALVDGLFPHYRGRLERARASFRPAEIAGRQTSWRHDDTRLHIDSFPATPVQGRRILRVFTNVNPEGKPRTWRVGEPFEQMAARFRGQLRMPWPLGGRVLHLVHATKSRRSAYDALMLQLHDRMKADVNYQATVAQTTIAFPAGSTWVAFTDAVSHAAMAGQYQLEQTFLLPVEAMQAPAQAPLRILERLMGRPLV